MPGRATLVIGIITILALILGFVLLGFFIKKIFANGQGASYKSYVISVIIFFGIATLGVIALLVLRGRA